MPNLFIITGSNGAGKSTLGRDFIPIAYQHLPIFDGDKLFMEKQRDLWKAGIKASKEAKKLAIAHVEETFDNLVDTALTNLSNFIYEGHFTNEATWDIPRKFKAAGFDIHLLFFGLSSLELSEARVIARAKEGGHYVDPLTLASNYYGNMEKLNKHFEMFNSIQVIDTSEPEPMILSLLQAGNTTETLPENELPIWFKQYLPAIFQAPITRI